MFSIVLVYRRPRQLPPMSVKIFIPRLTSPRNLQSPMLSLSRAELRSIRVIKFRTVNTTRMVRHPAVMLSLRQLLSLRLQPRRLLRPKRCRLDLCAMHGN